MKRLDYVLIEKDVEKRIDWDRVYGIIDFFCPGQAQAIDFKMRFHGQVFTEKCGGHWLTIEYRGPGAICAKQSA